jgi:putative SOS response-associated peptidase YedK
MCHDLSFTANSIEFITDVLPNIFLKVDNSLHFTTSDHILSMTHPKALVVISENKKQHIKLFEWGLIADYMNTPEKVKQFRIQMANARSEKIFDKQSAWYRLRKNRCLIAVTGFYEHRTIKGWKNKVPYYIQLANHNHFFLLGFYNYPPIPNLETGELIGTFTIITREANNLMKSIHNDGPNKHRMPLMLHPHDALNWIDDTLTDNQMKDILNYSLPSNHLIAQPVFTIRSTAERPDRKNKTAPYEWPNLPPLGNDEPPPQLTLFS